MNSFKHGMAGEGAVMLPEDRAKYEERVEAFSRSIRPRDELETYLVSRAALHSVKLDRGAAVETARSVESTRRAEADYAPSRIRAVEALDSQIRQWDRLIAKLDAKGTLYSEDRRLAYRLIGPRPKDAPPAMDLEVLANEADGTDPDNPPLPPALLAARPMPPGHVSTGTIPDDRRHRARDALRAFLEGRRALAVAERDRLLDELDSPALRDVARARAGFDDSTEGAPVRRYETASELGLFRILNFLQRRQKTELPADTDVFDLPGEPATSPFLVAPDAEPEGADSVAADHPAHSPTATAPEAEPPASTQPGDNPEPDPAPPAAGNLHQSGNPGVLPNEPNDPSAGPFSIDPSGLPEPDDRRAEGDDPDDGASPSTRPS